jgi:hypothetical protein
MSSRFVVAPLVVAVSVGVFFAPGGGSRVGAQASTEVIATALLNPRGLAFGPEGALYVAEAGRGGSGPCTVSPENAEVCYGETGAITRIYPLALGNQTRIITGLPSIASQQGATPGARAQGPQDIGFQGRGNGWVTIGFANDPAKRDDLGGSAVHLASLLKFLPNGRYEYTTDAGIHEEVENPDGGAIDTNPFGIAVLPSRTLYADAGANALNEVTKNGSTTLAVFPNLTVGALNVQAVPTSVVQWRDALYVGQLTGAPFPQGAANVYRVPSEGGTPEVFVTGFTNIIDLTVGPDDALYVLEIDNNGLATPGRSGAITRVDADGNKTPVISGLTAPGGIAFGPDGNIYVTTVTVSAGGGQVVRILR